MKLGEANKRRKLSGPSPKSSRLQYRTPAEVEEGQHVGHSDDESSIIAQPSKTPSCGACRTRESNVWWKAPKGLPTNILCNTCGLNWRKYADLNVRPVREEMLPSSKAREKRKGTPLSGQAAKQPRVYPFFFFFVFCFCILTNDCQLDQCFCSLNAPANYFHRSSKPMLGLHEIRPCLQSRQMQSLWFSCSCG